MMTKQQSPPLPPFHARASGIPRSAFALYAPSGAPGGQCATPFGAPEGVRADSLGMTRAEAAVRGSLFTDH